MSEAVRHGEFANEPQLYALLRIVAEKRNIARRTIDDIAEFPIGYTEKLLAQVPQKRMSIDSLFPLAWALGIRFVAVDDPSNLARIADLLNGRRIERVSACRASMRVKTASVLKKHAANIVKGDRKKLTSLGGKARAASLTPKRRRAIARHAANTRHKRERAERAAQRNAPGPITKPATTQNLSTHRRGPTIPTVAATSPIVRCCETKRDASLHPSAAQRRPAASEHQLGAKARRRADQRAPQS